MDLSALMTMENIFVQMENHGADPQELDRSVDQVCQLLLASLPPSPVYAEAILSCKDDDDASYSGGGGLDRISALPDALLGDIVSRLPTKDAARTAALSTRWRGVWLSTPLVLVDTGLLPPDASGGGDGDVERPLPLDSSGAVAAAVSRVLETHPGPFRCVELISSAMDARRRELARWLHLLAVKGVRELVLVNRRRPMDVALPATVFALAPLSRLHLGTWRFPDTAALPRGAGFPHLRELGLYCVHMEDRDLDFVLANSPVLEHLGVYYSQRRIVLLRLASHSLRCVQIRMCIVGEIAVVDAPRLERLLLWEMIEFGSCGRTKLRIGNAPKLQLLGYLRPGIDVLEIGNTIIKAGTKVSPRTIFPWVNVLALKVHFEVRHEAKLLPNFLKCFPYVVNLHIKSEQAHEPAGKLNLKFWQEADRIECLQSSISYVVFYGYRGERSELTFLKYILGSGQVLEEMVIVLVKGLFSSWDEVDDKLLKPLVSVKMANENCRQEKEILPILLQDCSCTLHGSEHQDIAILALRVNFGVLKEVTMLVSFLRCFPNIETLHIKSDRDYEPTGRHHAKFWREVCPVECINSHVKKIVLHEFQGNKCEFEFLKFISRTAQELQALLLMLTSQIYSSIDEDNEVNSQLALLSFASEECITSLLGPEVRTYYGWVFLMCPCPFRVVHIRRFIFAFHRPELAEWTHHVADKGVEHLVLINKPNTVHRTLNAFLPVNILRCAALRRLFLANWIFSATTAFPRGADDQISALPNNLLSEIVSRLPITDAIHTTSLSHGWSRIWHSIPLNLDNSQIKREGEHFVDEISNDALVARVSSILLSHPGPFSSVRLTCGNMGSHEDTLKSWFRAFAAKHLEELTFLNLHYPNYLTVPGDLFRCKSLRWLYLVGVQLPNTGTIPPTHMFHELQEICLFRCILHERDIENLLTCSPKVENLSLISNTCSCPLQLHMCNRSLRCILYWASLLEELVVVSAPGLERLILWKDYASDWDDCKKIRICSAPKLKVIGYLNPSDHVLQIGDAVIKNDMKASATVVVPSVEILAMAVRFGVRKEEQMVPCFLNCFPSIKILHVKDTSAKNAWNYKIASDLSLYDPFGFVVSAITPA
uniref:F-box domain-containing protein n=1 Tax=Leersia perrieri TaxID=77586 RepID=A0A0D9V2K1_9ORYZ